MRINKIVLEGGRIGDWHEIDTNLLNRSNLNWAREKLSALQSGTPSVSYPLSDDSEVTVALGLPLDENTERHLQEQWQLVVMTENHKERDLQNWWQLDHPGDDLSEYDAAQNRLEEQRRRDYFYLKYRGIITPYRLVLPDCSNNDIGLYFMVGGSLFLHFTTAHNQRSQQEREPYRHKCEKVVAEIVALKPAFIAPTRNVDPLSLFGDHFAIAMLLSSDSEDEGGAGVPAFLNPTPPSRLFGIAQELPTEENEDQ